MCRACPIPSANTVAQNPAGSFSPLSSLEHASLAAAIAAFGWLRTDASDPKTHTAPITPSKVKNALFLPNHPIGILLASRPELAANIHYRLRGEILVNSYCFSL